MHIASRPNHPARRRVVAALSAPIRTALRGRTCDGYEHQTFQFPQEDLNKYELRAEQRRQTRALAIRVAVTAAILAAFIAVGYRTVVKAPLNLSITLAQAESMRGM